MADLADVQRDLDPAAAVASTSDPYRKRGGMTSSEAAYMRGNRHPVASTIPMSTSKFLNSPLFVSAFSTHALRRMGPDVAETYDIPEISRAVDDVTDYREWTVLIEREKERFPAFATWLGERRISRYDPREMQHHAAGTLGAAIRDFITASGFDIEFIDKGMKPATDLEYMRKRAGECHDIHHMVTGFGPNLAGEHALVMMNVTANAIHFSPELASCISLSQSTLGASSFMRAALHYGAGMPLLLEATQLGIEAGRAIRRPLIMVNWEEYLDRTLEDIADELGFRRGPGDAWKTADHLLRG